jgi:DNA polymerase-3 subunit gamma/tau
VTYEPLHHKYRPQTFADLVGQEAIATTLTHAIELQRIAPAYLFTGPRGTGKTSSARILAKSLNCIQGTVPTASPCGVCEVCQGITRGNALDVIEIDAASNTGVDNIRDLIERAQFAPVQCRFKVYCLDEVHMLSTAAFNALLKTLEEPPDRVVFILATTDPQRVLPTIISRCQRFDFRRIPLPAMVAHLQHIAQQEKIAIATDAVELVAQIAQGGLRDAESLLDQLSLSAGEVTVERVWDLVGAVPEQDLLRLLDAIATGQPEDIIDTIRHLLDRGREPLVVLQNLSSFCRDLLIAKTAPHRRELVALTEPTWNTLTQRAQAWESATILRMQQHLRSCEVQIKNSTQPRLWLEVSILELLSAPPSTLPINVSPFQKISQLIAATPKISQPASSIEAKIEAKPATPTPAIAALNNGESQAAQAPTTSPPPPVLPSTEIPSESPSAPEEKEEEIHATPPTPTPTTSPESTASAAANEEGDLTQIWQMILEHLHRPSRALLKEHAQLTAFKGREAKIGIRNKNLARIAQSKLPDVEESFQKVFQRKVTVSLHVLSAPHSPTEPPSPIPQPSLPPSAQPIPDAARLPPIPQPSFNTQIPAPPSPEERTPNSTSLAETSSSLPTWENLDELTQASRSFAQFFNGALVNLDGLSTEVESPLPSPDLAATEEGEWDEP